MNMVYQYTSLEVLALILKKQNIRFNNLCKLDDPLEKYVKCLTFGEHIKRCTRENLGGFCFVSCWTEEKEESISMWDMYGDRKAGVRIGLPKDMFKPISCIYKKEKNKKPLINCNNTSKGSELDCFHVEYDRIKDEDPSLITNDLKLNADVLGKYKIKEWRFQKEIRYRFFAYKDSQSAKEQFLTLEMINEGLPDLFTNRIKAEYIDYPLREDIIPEMEIIIGPCMTEGDRILFDALTKTYGVGKDKIRDSIFYDKQIAKCAK